MRSLLVSAREYARGYINSTPLGIDELTIASDPFDSEIRLVINTDFENYPIIIPEFIDAPSTKDNSCRGQDRR
jgi:hypothetical protein